MLWHIFVILLSHSFLASIGMSADHDSLRGDQAVDYLFETGTFFSSCFVVVCFSVAGPLSVGGYSLA